MLGAFGLGGKSSSQIADLAAPKNQIPLRFKYDKHPLTGKYYGNQGLPSPSTCPNSV